MCGIVGYIGRGNGRDVVLDGLLKLEYRGYDSAGLALLNKGNGSVEIFKNIGRVKVLDNATKTLSGTQAIGHTRWATHGRVTTENAHPHESYNGRFVVVHNGIIENHLELKHRYLNDVFFKSETDTEVIAQLLAQEVAFDNDVFLALLRLAHKLEGSYALLVIDREDEDTIYALKDKPPLLIGKTQDGYALSSDVLALTKSAESFLVLEDKTLAVITEDEVALYNYDGKKLPIFFEKMKISEAAAERGKYPHFMLKEINEQPQVIKDVITHYFQDDGTIIIDPKLIKALQNAGRIYLIGAGTSRNAGLVGRRYFEYLGKKKAEVHIASEFAYNVPLLDDHPFFILISQSGETADLTACLDIIKGKGHASLTLTNVETSTLAREASFSLPLCAGPEIGVAATKSYIAELAVLSLLAYAMSPQAFNLRDEFITLIKGMESFLMNSFYLKSIVARKLIKSSAFYIGRGIDYVTAAEASLKLKEISYIHAEGFPAGELKHGTIALIEEGTPVIAIISEPSLVKNMRSNVSEVVARGATPLIITLKSLSDPTDDIILDDIHLMLTPLLLALPTQLIAYYAALVRGLDIDKPRNLAKCVTVE